MESGAKVPADRSNQMSSWGWLLITSLILGGLTYFLVGAADIENIRRNWDKYRCSPSVMPFAKLYGQDPTENFNFCLGGMFNSRMGVVLQPLYEILSVIIVTTMQFLKNLNSLRMMLATLLGGISKIIQEFVTRFKLIFGQVKTMALRMNMLMGRVFGIFYSLIYMAFSGITAGLNFGDTFIFKFLNVFCFAPETPIEIRGKGKIEISEVQLGDICEKTGSKVTSVYRFVADGQEMVYLNSVEVSTNHFVEYNGKWIESGNHPDAHPLGHWIGGHSRPLICLDTDDHRIPLGEYIFSDWDETSSSDVETMETAEQKLNGGFFLNAPREWLYQPAVDPHMKLRLKNNQLKNASEIKAGDNLMTGKVIGTGKRHVYEYVVLPTGERVTPSTLIWNETHWSRAGHMYPDNLIRVKEPIEMITMVVFKTACIVTSMGIMVRDMCEVHSPDMETPTRNALNPIKGF